MAAGLILVEPFEDIVYGGAGPSLTLNRGTGRENLLTNDPREIFVDTGAATNFNIDVDFGADRTWDTIALINVAADDAATWRVYGGATIAENTYRNHVPIKLPSEDGSIASAPGLFVADAPITSRFIRLTVAPMSTAGLSIGRLFVGLSFQPTLGHELGAGRPPQDTGQRQRLDDGTLAMVSGRLVSGFKWVFGDLEPADLKRLWGMYRRRRTTEPVLCVEDPADAVAEVVHYGTFVDLDAYERRDVSKSRMVMTVEDWS